MGLEEREEQREDPWAAARASQREDVKELLAQRRRLCPSCGAVQHGAGRHCPECGAELTARFPRWRSLRKFVIAGAALLLLAIGIGVLIVPDTREHAAGERARANARQRALEAAERARLTREARPIRADGPPLRAGADPLAHRATLKLRGEQLIATDARKRVAAGTIKDGKKVEGASCTPFPNVEERRVAEQDPATPAGRYDCVAYTSKFEAPAINGQKRTGYFGYPYWLVVDYPASKLVFCKVTPRGGEGVRTVALVPVPVPCRDPEGPG
jgi:hypothetical protein